MNAVSRSCSVLFSVLFVASCASAPTIPWATKRAAVCVYHFLKSKPDIIAVYIRVDEGYETVSYTFRDHEGKLVTTDLTINEPDATQRFVYSGDFESFGNPLAQMDRELNSACNATGAYDDLVIISGPNQK
jgi:hypothetical protein